MNPVDCRGPLPPAARRGAHQPIPSLVDRAGARLRCYRGSHGRFAIHAGMEGIHSIVLTRELGQGSYVAGVACLDGEGRIVSQAILGPGWSVEFEEPQS